MLTDYLHISELDVATRRHLIAIRKLPSTSLKPQFLFVESGFGADWAKFRLMWWWADWVVTEIVTRANKCWLCCAIIHTELRAGTAAFNQTISLAALLCDLSNNVRNIWHCLASSGHFLNCYTQPVPVVLDSRAVLASVSALIINGNIYIVGSKKLLILLVRSVNGSAALYSAVVVTTHSLYLTIIPAELHSVTRAVVRRAQPHPC